MSTVSAEIEADLQALFDAVAEGRPIDPEIAQRVRLRAEQSRDEVFRRFGYQDIGVELIREARDLK